MNKIDLLKSIDKIVGKPTVFLLSRIARYKKENPTSINNILFIRPGGIGDAVLLLPVIQSLREKFPDAHIDILCERRNADVFGLSRDIDRIYLYDKDLGLYKCLKKTYDVVIDTEQWHRLSAVVAYLTGAPVRIGFNTNERGRLFTHQIPYSHDDYEVYSFFHLIESFTGEPMVFDENEPFVDISNGVHSNLLPEVKKEDNIVAIFPGASVRERRLGGERFGKVASALSDKGYRIVIFGSDADRVDAETIKKYAPESIDLTGKTDLREVAAILKRSQLLITADSGIMHLSYAVGTPTLSLFGSGIEKKWAPRGKKHRVLNKHLACSPCTKFGYTPRCKIDAACLFSISVDELLHSAEEILNDASKSIRS